MSPISKRNLLQQINFGSRVAEDEAKDLAAYFVATDQWLRIFRGDVDIVYGAKGSGKSAIYVELSNRAQELSNSGIGLIAAENPRGNPAFKDLALDPPANEQEFIFLWKLYFLSLIGQFLKGADYQDENAQRVIRELETARLLARDQTLAARLRAALDYARSWLKIEAIEAGVKVDAQTQLPGGFYGKITMREPSLTNRDLGFVSVDSLFDQANAALDNADRRIWLALDRLDVAFAEQSDLEENALRALFRVYVDLLGFPRISLKLFLRTDIWQRITRKGFREATHITRSVTLTWNDATLLNLIVNRALKNVALRDYYGVTEAEIAQDSAAQVRFFHRVFPQQVNGGEKKPESFRWMLSRIADGTRQAAPRELIHLISAARDQQLRKLEVGEPEPADMMLFSPGALKDALPEVSQTRLQQTLYAEYPEVRPWLEAMRRQHTHQTLDSLMSLWKTGAEDTEVRADKLIEIGFFELPSDRMHPTYRVPILYRDALDMIQGRAK
jgi:hypothetical protein